MNRDWGKVKIGCGNRANHRVALDRGGGEGLFNSKYSPVIWAVVVVAPL